jgi:hypothetical protein
MRVRSLFLQFILISWIFCTLTYAASPWLNWAKLEYGPEHGELVYQLLAPLCENCDQLVQHPGIAAHYEDLHRAIQKKPLSTIQNAEECLNQLKTLIGEQRVYRGIALTPEEFSKIVSHGKMEASQTVSASDEIGSIKKNVQKHLLKFPGEKTPVLSVTSYPDIAAVVAKGYATSKDKQVYLFEYNMPKLDVWSYEAAYGQMNGDIKPSATTATIENIGQKTKVSETYIDPKGIRVTNSWDVYEKSIVLREVEYGEHLESFIYGEIPNKYINSVKVLTKEDLAPYDWRALRPDERAEILKDFNLTFEDNAGKNFKLLLSQKPSVYRPSSNCLSVLQNLFFKAD